LKVKIGYFHIVIYNVWHLGHLKFGHKFGL
jgi:hypothetical protein